MLPLLRKQQESSVNQVDDVKHRKPDDEEGEFEMLDAVVEDMFEAFQKKDKRLLKMALEALIEHIQEEDEMQDHAEDEQEF